jgi:hypothetical protein
MARKPRDARTSANRRNAQRSTGPRTSRGKKRVAQNALRHGLAVPINGAPAFDERIDRLTLLLAGPRADEERINLARRVAEAQIDLGRVRTTKLALLKAILQDHERLTNQLFRQAKAKRTIIRLGKGSSLEDFKQAQVLFKQMSEGNPGAREGPTDPSEALRRLDRYERRARSRRATAIRAFDTAFGARREL